MPQIGNLRVFLLLSSSSQLKLVHAHVLLSVLIIQGMWEIQALQQHSSLPVFLLVYFSYIQRFSLRAQQGV